jgi:hypothetical protein
MISHEKMNRRSFLQSILALGMAPAIVRADSLMRIVPRDMMIAPPQELWARSKNQEILLSWEPVYDAATYEVAWEKEGLFVGRMLVQNRTVIVPNLLSGAKYDFTVKALNS